MTPRTPGGRFGKALSDASTAPTSAEGLMRQRHSQQVIASVPVPSESEAITLGHHGHGQEPMRISALWYLNVHAPPPFEWLRTQAVLYPNVLILTWIAPTGGRGVVTLDLVNCTEVRSAPSPSHPSARDDVGSVAARLQSAELAETLCPFQLLYTDGVERLGTDTARERVRWVGSIWDVLATIARGPPRALTDGSESETGTLQRSSSVRSHSSEGSATTSFVAPAVDIAETASVVSYIPRETADDISVASLVPPSRAPSLRRTASMADLELEADIDRALGRTPAPASSSEEESNLLSLPRSRSQAYSDSDGSGYRTPTTDRPHSSRYSASIVTGREDTTYVPTDTEQSTVRGVRIVADSISFRGSSSVRGDTHDALSTGYGSTARSEGVVSSATYSRRRTLSGVSSSGSGLTRSHGLRRPTRDRTLSVSPAASRRQSLAAPSDVRSDSDGSYSSFQPRSPSVATESVVGPSTYGSIAYEVCETSDMSEFTIDQTGSHVRTVTSGTMRQPSPSKLSEEFITAEGSSESHFETVQPCSESGFETVTICPPSTDYEDTRKCECPPSVEISEEMIEEPTPVPQPIELSPPLTRQVSSLQSPSTVVHSLSPSTVTWAAEPDVYELSPPPSEHTSMTHSPDAFSTYTPEAEEPEVLELSPPPSQQRSSMHSPSMVSIEPDASSLSGTRSLRSHLPSIRPLTVSSRSPTRTLSSLTPSPSLLTLTDRQSPSRVPTVQDVSTERSPTLALYTSPEQMTQRSPSPEEQTPTERPPTEYPPTEPSEHESPLRLPSEYTSLSEPSDHESPELERAPSIKAPSTIPEIQDEEIVETPRPTRTSYSRSPSLPPRPVSLTFPSPAPMTISDESGGEEWLASPSSINLSLSGRAPSLTPTLSELLPPPLSHASGRTASTASIARSSSLSSVDTISTLSDVSPPGLMAPRQGTASPWVSGTISSVGSMATSMVSPPGLMQPHLGPGSSHRHSRTISSVPSETDSAYIPGLMPHEGPGSSYLESGTPSSIQSFSDTASIPGLVGPSRRSGSSDHRSRTLSSVQSVSDTASIPGLVGPSRRPGSSDQRSHTLSSVQSVSDTPSIPGLVAPSIGRSSDRRSRSVSSIQSVSDTASLPGLMPPSTRAASSHRHTGTISSVHSMSDTASLPGLITPSIRPGSSHYHSGTISSVESDSDTATIPGLIPPSVRPGSSHHRSATISSVLSVSDTASPPGLLAPSIRDSSSSPYMSSVGSMTASILSPPGLMRQGVRPGSSHRQSATASTILSMSDTVSPPQLLAPSIHEGSSHWETTSLSSVETSSDTISPPRLAAPSVHESSTHFESGTPSTVESISDTVSPPHLMAPSIQGETQSPHMSSVASTASSTVSPPGLVRQGRRPQSSRHHSESVSSFMSSSTATPPGLIPPSSRDRSTVHAGSLPSIGSISPMSNLPPLQHPGLHVPSTTARSRSVSSEGSISMTVPSMGPSALSASSAESMSSPSVSSVSLSTMPSIIVPYTAPPSPSPPESYALTSVPSVTASLHMPSLHSVHITPEQSIHIAPASSLGRHSSIRSTMTIESNVSYTSADLEPSPPFIPVDLPDEAEYEPTYSGLEDTLSIVSGTTASRGYDVIRQYPSTPSLPTAESMETAEIDNESLQLVSAGSDVRPATPSRIAPSVAETSLSDESTITLPSLPKSAPKTPSLHTTYASSISMTTPEGNKPSIESIPSRAETIYSDGDLNDGAVPPSHIISHDVNRLLQYLHEVDTVREGESRDLADNLRRIEEELFDLSAFLRQRRPSPPPAPQPAPAEPQVIRVEAPSEPTQVIRISAPRAPTEVHEELPSITSREPSEVAFEEYVPMSDASTDVSISSREEEATPIAVAIPARPKSEVSSLDLTESIASLTEPSPTIGSVTISDESSLSGTMLSDSSITGSPTASVSEISGVSVDSMSLHIPSTPTPISVRVPISPSISSAATPELTPPSSQSSPSREAVGLTPSPSVQPDVLPEPTIKSSTPSLSRSPSIRSISSLPKETSVRSAILSKSPSIRTATETAERSETPVPAPAPVKRAQSLSPPPMRAPSPGGSESDYFISSPLSQDTFRSLPRAFSSSPSISEISIASHGTARPDSKSSIGLDELRGLLRDLLKQQDEVTGRQESQRAILEELRTRPPPTVVYQAPETSELVEHRTALTKIENILGDLVERFEVVRDSISSTTLTRSSTLTTSSDTISSSTPSRPITFYSDGTGSSEDERRRLEEQWDRVSRKPETQLPATRRSPVLSLAGGLPPSEATESEVSVPPPTATTQLPLIPAFRPRMRRRRARSASPSITFERIISSAESSSPSSSSISYSRVREEVSESIIPKFGRKIPQAPDLPEPSRTSAEELGQDIDFEQKLREIRKRKEPSGDGTYIPSMPQPPAQPVLPDWATVRDEDATPRPPSPPSELGQGPSRRSPISESWYTRPRPAPTEEQATEVG
ncbi:hypothetical protein B0J17DRAFT_433910 [Rhizoctonia solani]|nr:hypothetical protein B0J17DRAFT_433910 [Rhizoctonia solani]